MCGRFVQNFAKEDIQKQFPQLLIDINWLEKEGSSSYNVAPGHLVWVLDHSESGEKVVLNRLQWGFSIKTAANAQKMVINMRLDRLLESKNWEKAVVEDRRILIPANGWFEWKRNNGKSQPSLPYYFEPLALSSNTSKEKNLLYLAALVDNHGNFGIVTQTASKDLAEIHDRMPLMLESENEQQIWLQKSAEEAISLIRKKQKTLIPEHKFISTLVSNKVNTVVNNSASLIQEVKAPPTQGSLF